MIEQPSSQPCHGRPYIPRIVDSAIRRGLASFAGMLVTGPRAVGKTRTGLRFAASQLRLDDPDDRDLCRADPMSAIERQPPVLIDEWQLVPEVLFAVKRRIDDGAAPGSFVVTGSARNDLLTDLWPGTGRLVRFRLWGMTARERFGAADALPLFERWADEDNRFSVPAAPPRLRDYMELALSSGFPAMRLPSPTSASGRDGWIPTRSLSPTATWRRCPLVSGAGRMPVCSGPTCIPMR